VQPAWRYTQQPVVSLLRNCTIAELRTATTDHCLSPRTSNCHGSGYELAPSPAVIMTDLGALWQPADGRPAAAGPASRYANTATISAMRVLNLSNIISFVRVHRYDWAAASLKFTPLSATLLQTSQCRSQRWGTTTRLACGELRPVLCFPKGRRFLSTQLALSPSPVTVGDTKSAGCCRLQQHVRGRVPPSAACGRCEPAIGLCWQAALRGLLQAERLGPRKGRTCGHWPQSSRCPPLCLT
jgi:hypothetical protein